MKNQDTREELKDGRLDYQSQEPHKAPGLKEYSSDLTLHFHNTGDLTKDSKIPLVKITAAEDKTSRLLVHGALKEI